MDLIEILVLLLDVYSAQTFMTKDVISSGALLRSVIKLGKLGRLEDYFGFRISLIYIFLSLLPREMRYSPTFVRLLCSQI